MSTTDTTSTFVDNMSLPIHRWYRYSAGFSAEWVEKTIEKYIHQNNIQSGMSVLDPFSGSGTTLLVCDKLGINSYGYEAHPLVYEISSAKLLWNTDINLIREMSYRILDIAKKDQSGLGKYPDIVEKCYDEVNLKQIDCLKKALDQCNDESDEYKLVWLGFVAMLRTSSHAGTATWQYVLPNKKKARVVTAFEAFEKQINMMIEDIIVYQSNGAVPHSKLFLHDARESSQIGDSTIDLIITSPPYANNYDYADATRLELSVLGRIGSWGDLQEVIRPGLVRSCSQMVSKDRKRTYEILKEPLLSPIYEEIYDVCSRLDAEKENHGGKKNYHTMIALYFLDLAKVWYELRRVCKKNAEVCFVIGDSAPYGVYVPVDEWLGKLALAAGFTEYRFEKTRDRNVKWKNRKHNVPLKEGHLWVRG